MSKIAEFWDAFAAKDNDKLIKLIEKEPTLVNEVQADNKNSFLLRSLNSKRPQDLLKCIVTSPSLNFNYEQGTEHTTTRKVLIESAQIDLIKLVLENPEFLFSDNELAYSLAIQAQKKFTTSYKERHEKNPTTPTAIATAEKMKNLAVIIPILREATRKYALEKKDDDLLQRLNSQVSRQALLEKNQREVEQLQNQLEQLRTSHTKEQERLYRDIGKEHEAFIEEAQSIISRKH
ncbi:hypothetical protein [Legionella saoudiensis]|uniref:hypothetical protein n=1 Tax=Legionella saoudiensis TaxID=1750561 RepID=UPI00073117A3|nr:hypothetical protein [Legionella saoudiensis]